MTARQLTVVGNRGITTYAAALRRAKLVSAQEMKDLQQVGGLRNEAAHGAFQDLSRERAGFMEQQVNFLLTRLARLLP